METIDVALTINELRLIQELLCSDMMLPNDRSVIMRFTGTHVGKKVQDAIADLRAIEQGT